MSELQLSPYAEVLADLERERDGLTAAINVIRRKMGLAPEESAPKIAASVANGTGSNDKGSSEIKPDSFFGMKLPDAIRSYFAITKRPALPSTIAKALLDGGLQSTAKDFNSMVQTAINRMKGEVVRVPNGWALAEWYPGRNFDKPKKGEKPSVAENGSDSE
jgi:hypothetical protein